MLDLEEANFVQLNISGHSLAIGQWGLLSDEIPVQRVSTDEYVVYVGATFEQVERWLEERNMCTYHVWDILNRMAEDTDQLVPHNTPKFVKKGHGSRRLRLWESPKFFS